MKRNILFGEKKLPILILLLMITIAGCMQNKTKSCGEINDVIAGKINFDEFAMLNFDKIQSLYQNPIFPYKIQLKLKKSSVTFLSIPVVDAWALSQDSQYSFYMLIHKNRKVSEAISKSYGYPGVEIGLEINDRSNFENSYEWRYNNINIMLKDFINVEMLHEYDSCYMLIIGNMPYKSIIYGF